jgi:hypothetical protein
MALLSHRISKNDTIKNIIISVANLMRIHTGLDFHSRNQKHSTAKKLFFHTAWKIKQVKSQITNILFLIYNIYRIKNYFFLMNKMTNLQNVYKLASAFVAVY